MPSLAVVPRNMPATVLCTCRSHCSVHDARTNSYTGGQLVSKASRFQHRIDDTRLVDLDDFATRVASTILDENSRLGLSRCVGNSPTLASSPLSREVLSQELLTIETEIRGRITWAPTNPTLVFVGDPVPDHDFENPLLLTNYLPNNGPHALKESHQRNLAFIENENRLFEIILHLSTLTHHPDQRDALKGMASLGLEAMMRSKKREWDRQRVETTAIENGFAVVRTGLTSVTICETRPF